MSSSTIDSRLTNDEPKEKLSIVLVTSAIPMHPKTDLIDLVIASLDLVKGVQDCDLIIVCDRMKVIEPDRKTNWKSGRVNNDSQLKYEQYIETLRRKYLGPRITLNETTSNQKEKIQINIDQQTLPLHEKTCDTDDITEELLEDLKYLKVSKNRRRSNVKILYMTSHMGFAHCLREGLDNVNTEYVLVMQHDRAFSENLDIHPILNLLDKEKSIRYIGFQTAANKQYVYKKLKSKYRIKSNEKDLIEGALIPIMYWYDSTHISRTKDYIKLIQKECKIGQFIETTYGGKIEQQISKEIESGLWSFQYHMDNYGMFMWYDEKIGLDTPMCRHLDGRGFCPMEERIKEGWPPMNHHLHNVKDIIQKIHKVNNL